MSKWKRKKYQENQVDTGEEEFSPLGLALLEQFAAGVSVPCLSNNYLDVFFVNVTLLRHLPSKPWLWLQPKVVPPDQMCRSWPN